MSADLTVRYSDVMQAERDFNNLTRSAATSSDYSDSTMSVRDARKRFEQMSSSATTTTPNYKRSEAAVSRETPVPARPPPPKPLKKRSSEPVMRSHSTCATSNSRVQSSSNQSADGASAVEETAQDVSNGSPKAKAKGLKPSLKKAHSVRPGDLASTSSEASSSDTKSPVGVTKKLFKRMSSSEKGKLDSTAASNGSAKGKNEETSQNSPTSISSPSHRKFSSPLALKKKRTSASSSSSSQPSPLPDSHRKSFSNKVLASTEERRVQASLKEEDQGKVVGGHRPTTPRVIEDGELKLNLTEGEGCRARF